MTILDVIICTHTHTHTFHLSAKYIVCVVYDMMVVFFFKTENKEKSKPNYFSDI